MIMIVKRLFSLVFSIAAVHLYGQATTDILVIGNELTKCAPVPAWHWKGNWGLAATSEANDYSHQLLQKIHSRLPLAKLHLDNIMYEDTMTGWIHLVPNSADIIIIQLGDNWHGGISKIEYRNAYRQMLVELRGKNRHKLLICLGPWRNKAIEPAIAAAAKEAGARFISLAPFAAVPANRSTVIGAGFCPNDHGMQAIADAIWQQLSPEIDRTVVATATTTEEYIKIISKMADSYKSLLRCNGTSKSQLPERDTATKCFRANAVYPVIYSSKMRMNGTLKDWEDVPIVGHLTVPAACYGPVPETLSAYFKVAASDQYLYILAVAHDRELRFVNGPPYHSDCFEFFIDPFFSRNLRSDDSTIQIFATLNKDDKKPRLSGKIIPAAKMVKVSGGWGLEIAIPLNNEYFTASVFDGLMLGFNISYNNNDAGHGREQKIGWSGIDTEDGSWRNPAVFGALRFVRADSQPVRPVIQGPAILTNRAKRRAGETLKDYSVLAHSRPQPEHVYGFQSGDLRNGQSFRDMANNWNANAVRLQLHQLGPQPTWKPKNFPIFLNRLEVAVKQARDAGLKVIPILYEIPFDLKGRNMWNCPELEDAYVSYWTEVVKRLQPYKDAIWGYDLINEPLERSQLPYAPLQWRKLAIKLIRAIRKVDPDAWIVYEAGPGGDWRGFEDLKPLPDDKIIYSLHFYEPGAFTHQGIAATKLQDPNLIARAQQQVGIRYPGVVSGIYWDRTRFEDALKPVIEFQKKYNVPIYVGEFSVVAWAPPECSAQYLKDVTDIFDKYGWSWTYHAFREYSGWRLDVEEGVFQPGKRLKYVPDTKRGAVIKAALKRHVQNNIKK